MSAPEGFPYSGVTDGWFPLLPVAKLRDKPIAANLLGEPLVLARLEGKACAFQDRCPHRLIPLSQGNICNNRLACRYHGWEFDAAGRLRHTPGSSECGARATLQSYVLQERDGLIWGCLKSTPTEALVCFSELPDYVWTQAYRRIRCSLFHTIENFLDPCHTPYIHQGLLRSQGPQQMQIEQTVSADGFATHYALTQKQNGWINRLFDPGVDQNIARFKLPGLVELDYLKNGRLLFRSALYFVPHSAEVTGIFVRLYAPRSWMPAALRFALFKPFVHTLYIQDKQILEQQQLAQQTYGERYLFSHTDVAARPLWALLHGQSPIPSATKELNFQTTP
ncbi:Rieske 2Fe-2S domain-containing protein [Hahella sp. NBU794]|uniref:Rieske 2Fe-2S domain-containing protein n=1 Tax=Hahella sp. NBU794 TaxID=3422590 RepID=UPI003D6FBCBC